LTVATNRKSEMLAKLGSLKTIIIGKTRFS